MMKTPEEVAAELIAVIRIPGNYEPDGDHWDIAEAAIAAALRRARAEGMEAADDALEELRGIYAKNWQATSELTIRTGQHAIREAAMKYAGRGDADV